MVDEELKFELGDKVLEGWKQEFICCLVEKSFSWRKER